MQFYYSNSIAIPSFSPSVINSIYPTILSIDEAENAVIENNRLHPTISKIPKETIIKRLEDYVSLTLIEEKINAFISEQGNMTIYSQPFDEIVFAELIHQFKRKTYLIDDQFDTDNELIPSSESDIKQINGVCDISVLNNLGFVNCGLSVNVDSSNRKIVNTEAKAFIASKRKKIKRTLNDESGNEVEVVIQSSNWFDFTVHSTFLGRRCFPDKAMHFFLIESLRKVETYLMNLPENTDLTIAELGAKMGINEGHHGIRLKDANMHSLGIGLDINYEHNPWFSSKEAYNAFKRAKILIQAETLSAKTLPAYLNQVRGAPTIEVCSVLAEDNEIFVQYLELKDNLPIIMETLNFDIENIGTSNIKTKYKDAFGISTFGNIESFSKLMQKKIENDYHFFSTKQLDSNPFYKSKIYKRGVRNPLNGFFNLDDKLVYALREIGGFSWGAIDFGPSSKGCGDFMHFDLRENSDLKSLNRGASNPEHIFYHQPKVMNKEESKTLIDQSILSFGSVRFHNSQDIHDFFSKNGNSENFIDWFRSNIAEKDFWSSGVFFGKTRNYKTIPKSALTNFDLVWNTIIPWLPNGDEGINLFQFFALCSLVINETGGHFVPLSENGGLAYMFGTNEDKKKSYNASPANRNAFELFNDEFFLSSHKEMLQYDYVQEKARFDERWSGEAYPIDAPELITNAGIIAEADFFKFRGRGLIQTTFRNNYIRIIEEIINYSGENNLVLSYKEKWSLKYGADFDKIATASKNTEWDDLFMNSDLVIPCIAIKTFHTRRNNFLDIDVNITSSEVLNGTNSGSFYYVGFRTGGSENYGKMVKARILQMLSQLINAS